ncbi:MAG: sn-glycerol-3-phosphate ABC transporter ATP-binding protein UgpC [Thermoanaerobaculia bacterium]
MATVGFERIRKFYGNVPVFEDFSLEVNDGEFLVVVGPSGCGKSTLLRLLAGLEELDAGEVRIAGRRVNELPPRERDIAMVFQSYALYPHMSVRRNLGFGLEMRRVAKDEVTRRVDEAARLLGLDSLLDRRPAQLSGGQRQRVALGRALVRQPAVFLFDEPLSNLDAALRVSMRAEIAALHRRLGTTTIYVTHDQVEAMTMGTRVAILDRGVLQQAATPRAIYDRPANVFVARFIGTPRMSLFEARWGSTPGTLVIGERTVACDLGPPPGVSRDTRLLAGFRAEAARPGASAPRSDTGDAGSGTLAFQVDFLEQLGHETLAHGRVAGSADPVVVRFAPRAAPSPGKAMEIAIDPAAWHLFDAATGARLENVPV